MENRKDNESFNQLVNEAIDKCEKFLEEQYNFPKGMALEQEIRAKFSHYITGLTDRCENLNTLTSLNNLGQTDIVQKSIMSDIFLMKNSLISYRENGYMNPETTSDKNIFDIDIVTAASAQQTQITNINIAFTNTIEQIKEMSGLSDKETEETIAKIEEIKAIIDQGGSKKTKWQKIKPILIWLADKSVDVGCALLPLILKIGE